MEFGDWLFSSAESIEVASGVAAPESVRGLCEYYSLTA